MIQKLSFAERSNLVDVALGKATADSVLIGGNVVNVNTLEVYAADVAIKSGRIVFVGDVTHTIGKSTIKHDVSGKYLIPGLIDTHIHAGGCLLNMTELGKLCITKGSVILVTDFYEAAIVAGKDGVREDLKAIEKSGVKVLFVIPMGAYYQNYTFENNGNFDHETAMEVLKWDECFGINELNIATIAAKNKNLMELVFEAQRLGKTIIGHAANVRGRDMQAALNFIDVVGDHECLSWEEANEKARAGMYIQLRHGSIGSDIKNVVQQSANNVNTIGDFMYCTDEISPDEMILKGYMDDKIRTAIASGVAPLLAIRAATLNAARMLRLDHIIGSITPGKCADIVTIGDLAHIDIDKVFVDGELLAEGGNYLLDVPKHEYPAHMLDTLKVGVEQFKPEHFAIKAPSNKPCRVRIIDSIDNTLFTGEYIAEMIPDKNGYLQADETRDILKMSTWDRHGVDGKGATCFIRGFGIKDGAFGNSYGPCAENLNILGTNDADIAIAANYILEKKGAFVVVRNGEIIAAMDTPILGFAADMSYKEAANKISCMHKELYNMGYRLSGGPFHMMAFMIFPFQFGDLKLSTYGLAKITSTYDPDELISMFVEE